MTWNPIFPLILVVLVTLALVGGAVFGLLRARGRGRLSYGLLAVVAVLLGIACLRPGVGTQSAQTTQSDVDVVFVVDTTASMVAEDWNGGPRIDGVKEDIMALAQTHAGARFALITFDASAVQRLPFTNDATALQSAVTTLRPEITLYSNGSSIAIANDLVDRVLERSATEQPEHARLVYYFGDGEQTSSKAPESFSASADRLAGGAVLGYGTTAGGPMKETLGMYSTASPQYLTTRDGAQAISKLDEQNLQSIASQLGVAYELRAPGTPVAAAEVDPAKLDTGRGNDVETAFDLYWIFAIAAFLLLLPEVWLGIRSIRELQRARGDIA